MASNNSAVGAPGQRARPRRRRSPSEVIGLLFVGSLVVMGAVLAGGGVYDQIQRRLVRPAVMRTWVHARQVLARRLKQPVPLELGAVWTTHSGMICGQVNGRGSFGGLTGMTPFAVEGERAVFALDQTAVAFAPYWRDCMTDQWITLQAGSMQAGGCATKLGQARCLTVAG
ncbi:MAG TPA: hypothetical protein VIJ94_06800 [Caulobacteraceae bacterium]